MLYPHECTCDLCWQKQQTDSIWCHVALAAGDEYNLTDDLAGMAAGGQILMGPKTFQR